MKGFKPTGFGPSAGFKFPTKFGFTGSSGAYTNVQPYVRRRAFADGGFVRQDNPRMKEESPGDQGSALVRRAKSYCALDQESGGKTPLRPGYKDGGHWIAGATKNKGALHRALGVPEGQKIPAKKMAKAAKSSNPTMRKRAALAKTLGKMKKADGGMVRGSSAKGFLSSVADIPELVRSVTRNKVDDIKRAMAGGERTVEGRNRSVMESVDTDVGGKTTASNYARGGKMKRGLMTKC
jgi:hypothetical protein